MPHTSSIPEAPSNRLLNAGDLAERWGVSKDAVYRMVRQGRIPAVRLGKHVRFHQSSIDEFEANGGVERDAA